MNRQGPAFDILFHKYDGSASRREQVARAVRRVDEMSEKELSSKADEQVLEVVRDLASVELPTLDRDNISYERKTRSIERVDHFGDRVNVEEVLFVFDVPFSGDASIFLLNPNLMSTNPPRGDVEHKTLRIAVQGEDDPQKVKAALDAAIARVEEYLEAHRRMWAGVAEEALNQARPRLAQRRQKLATLSQTEQGLAGLGFKPKA